MTDKADDPGATRLKGFGDGTWTRAQIAAAWAWLDTTGYVLVPAATGQALQTCWRAHHPGQHGPAL